MKSYKERKEIKTSDNILDYLYKLYEKFNGKSKRDFDYSTWVLPHLDKAFDMSFQSLEDESGAEEVVKLASKLIPTLHNINLERNQEQETHFIEKLREKEREKRRKENEKNNPSQFAASEEPQNKHKQRKDKGIQIYHPTKGNAYQYIVKQVLANEEKKREMLGIQTSSSAAIFRFYHKLLENENLMHGICPPIAGVFGILYDRPSNWQVEISTFLNGISMLDDTGHYNFRDKRYFDLKGADIAAGLVERFGEKNFFETVSIDEQDYHKEIKKFLSKHTKRWFKFAVADEYSAQYVEKIIERFIPWESQALPIEKIPSYDLRDNVIDDFVFNGENPATERQLVFDRIASLLKGDFRNAFLEKKGVRRKNMSQNMLVPVIKGFDPEGRMEWKEVKPLGVEAKYAIASEALSRPLPFRQLHNFNLSIEIDGTEVATIESDYGKYEDITILKGSKILAIWAKLKTSDLSEIAIPLATILLDFTGTFDGVKWSSESKLENSKHIGIRLSPVKDLDGVIGSLRMTVDYHAEDRCDFPQESRSRIAWIRSLWQDKFTDFVPVSVAKFLYDIEEVELFSESGTNRKVLKTTFAFSLLANVVTMLSIILALSLLNYDATFSSKLLIPAIMIISVLLGMFFLNVRKNDGINKSFRLSNQYGFLAGILSLTLLTYFFTADLKHYNYLTLKGNTEQISSSDFNSVYPDKPADPQLSQANPSTVGTGVSEDNLDETAASGSKPPIPFGGTFYVTVVAKSEQIYRTQRINVEEIKTGEVIKAFPVQSGVNSKAAPARGESSRVPSFATMIFMDKTTAKIEGGEELTLKFKLERLQLTNGKVIEFNNKETLVSVKNGGSQQQFDLNLDDVCLAGTTDSSSSKNAVKSDIKDAPYLKEPNDPFIAIR